MSANVNATAGAGSKLKIKQALESRDTFGTCLVALLLDNYGADAFEWEVESITAQLSDDYGAVLPMVNVDKMMGLITAMTTNQFQVSWELFSQICRALNGDEADFDTFSPIDPEDIAWGTTEVLLNDPPDEENGTDDFSHEVKQYAGITLAETGIFQPPKVLGWVELPYADPTLALDTAFVDDPDMFSASQMNQVSAGKALEVYIQERTMALKQQLAALPLTNRDKAPPA